MRNKEKFALILKSRGLLMNESKYKVQCPFHEGDREPSLLIDLAAGNFKCFGCGAHGGYESFWKLLNKGVSDSKSELLLARLLNSKKMQTEKLELTNYEKTYVDYEASLEEAQQRWLSFPPTRWKSYSNDNYAIQRGFSKSFLQHIGAKWLPWSDYAFALPIVENGEFVGFVQRMVIEKDEETDYRPKYLYNEGFNRSANMFGHFDNKTPLIVTEGSFDMLRVRQAGYKNVVALLGWYLAGGQLEKLKAAGIKNVLSMLDNDEAGYKGSKLLKQHFSVKQFKYDKSWKDKDGRPVKDPGGMNNHDLISGLCMYGLEPRTRNASRRNVVKSGRD